LEFANRESHQFPAEYRFPYMAPDEVESVLKATLTERITREARAPFVDAPPAIEESLNASLTFYVNPLGDRDLVAKVAPGHLLVDLTHASYDDLQALAPVLTDIQARLGYKKQRGRQYEGNPQQMEFVHQLRTTPTGRGKPRTWKRVRDAVHAKFGEDISENTLKQRYRTWLRSNTSRE
jgi:hypothetical protein